MIDQFARVVFGEPTLKDPKEWQKSVEVVKLLCGIALVTRWLSKENSETDYICVAFEYMIDQVTITHLPHWGFYKVDGVPLNLPSREQDVIDAVVAIKTLKRLGMVPDKK